MAAAAACESHGPGSSVCEGEPDAQCYYWLEHGASK